MLRFLTAGEWYGVALVEIIEDLPVGLKTKELDTDVPLNPDERPIVDVCVLPAISVIGETVVSSVLAESSAEKFSCDALSEMKLEAKAAS